MISPLGIGPELTNEHAAGHNCDSRLRRAAVEYAVGPALRAQRQGHVATLAQAWQLDSCILARPSAAASARVVGDLVAVEGARVAIAKALAGRQEQPVAKPADK